MKLSMNFDFFLSFFNEARDEFWFFFSRLKLKLRTFETLFADSGFLFPSWSYMFHFVDEFRDFDHSNEPRLLNRVLGDGVLYTAGG